MKIKCKKCSDKGWLWRDELDIELDNSTGPIIDDTRYPCNECFPDIYSEPSKQDKNELQKE